MQPRQLGMRQFQALIEEADRTREVLEEPSRLGRNTHAHVSHNGRTTGRLARATIEE
jgi:hypothetical protein